MTPFSPRTKKSNGTNAFITNRNNGFPYIYIYIYIYILYNGLLSNKCCKYLSHCSGLAR